MTTRRNTRSQNGTLAAWRHTETHARAATSLYSRLLTLGYHIQCWDFVPFYPRSDPGIRKEYRQINDRNMLRGSPATLSLSWKQKCQIYQLMQFLVWLSPQSKIWYQFFHELVSLLQLFQTPITIPWLESSFGFWELAEIFLLLSTPKVEVVMD